MHKFLYLSFAAALIFGLGVVSGNLSHAPRQSPAPSTVAAVGDRAAVGPTVEKPPNSQPGAELSLESFLVAEPEGPVHDPVQPLATEPVGVLQATYESDSAAPLEPTALLQTVTAASPEETKRIITEYFPAIDEPTLAGWMESYAGMSSEDLHGVLQQRALLGDQLSTLNLSSPALSSPALSSQDLATLPPTVPPPPVVPAEPLSSQVIRTAQDNLRHLMTVGYRRTVVRTEVASISADASRQDARVAFQFDLAEGQRQTSRSPLHVAIASGEDCMFVLEPDNLLTRNGQFQLAADGRIGLQSGATFVAVRGPSIVPPGATHVRIAEDATVHYQDLEGEAATAGTLSVVRIHAPLSLRSANGVYFQMAGDAGGQGGEPQLSEVEKPQLHLQTVELSNVNEHHEQSLIDHFGGLGPGGREDVIFY